MKVKCLLKVYLGEPKWVFRGLVETLLIVSLLWDLRFNFSKVKVFVAKKNSGLFFGKAGRSGTVFGAARANQCSQKKNGHPGANTPLVCPREGLVEQQSLKEEIRFPIFNPHGFFQPRTQHGKRPSGSKNEKIDTGALPTLFFGPNPRPMKVLAARNTFEKNRHGGLFDPRTLWVVLSSGGRFW